MVATRTMTRDEAKKAGAEDVSKELNFNLSYRATSAPHFVDYVIAGLETQLGSATLHQGGLSVYTTIDPGIQKAAEQSVADLGNGMRIANKGDVAVSDLKEMGNRETSALHVVKGYRHPFFAGLCSIHDDVGDASPPQFT